jgi:hypothetical protein
MSYKSFTEDIHFEPVPYPEYTESYYDGTTVDIRPRNPGGKTMCPGICGQGRHQVDAKWRKEVENEGIANSDRQYYDVYVIMKFNQRTSNFHITIINQHTATSYH